MRLLLAHIILLLLPLTILAQKEDTTATRITRQWKLSSDFTTEVVQPLDTAFSLFQRYRITDKYSLFNAYPGNYGQPVYQINFFDRDQNPDRYLISYYLPYMYTPSRALFVNTQVPFTEVAWTNGGARAKSEQTFRIRHSQNINRRLNFGLIFDIVSAVGQYDNQKAVDKNFLFHTSYNGDVYTSYFSAGINNHQTQENGGVVGEEFLSQYNPEDVPMKLNEVNNAKNILKNRYLMLVQRYSPGGKRDSVTGEMTRSGPVTFSYIGSYEWNKRRYFDEYPLTEFYDTVMISSVSSEDSLSQGLILNTLRIDFAAGRTGRFRIGTGAGVRSEIRNYAQVVPGDSLTRQDTITRNQNSLVLTGKIFNNIGEKFGWMATGDLWFQGYRAGDFTVDGRIFKDFQTNKGMITWDATVAVANVTPSLWYSSWGSNNFSWQHDNGREFRVTAGSSLLWPDRNMSVRFNYAVIDNFIHMGPDAMPSQYEAALSVASLTLWKEFVFWKLHWDNQVLLQQSSKNDVLSLPLATGRTALFLEHLFKFKSTNGELNVQLGAEAMAHTRYNAMGYMPATGRFFSQNEIETGNYPFVNIFLNFKVKRTRVFIMFDHINAGTTGYNYYLIPGYPLNIRMFRYGISWTFYD